MHPCKTFSNIIRSQNHIKFIGIEEFQTELFRYFALYVHLCIYTHTHTHTHVSSFFFFCPWILSLKRHLLDLQATPVNTLCPNTSFSPVILISCV